MKVTLTGANGFIGSHIVAELQGHGHEVTALVRDAARADVAADRGAAAVVTDLYDRSAVVRQLAGADAAIHTAGANDETSAEMDAAVADAAIDAFAGTGKPYLHIGVLQIYGASTSITEDSPMSPPSLVAWRFPIEQRVLAATGMRGVVIESSVAYGDGGGGLPASCSAPPATKRATW
ncbi:MAG TPA: NAD(P)H-binding protein [Solirubrobacteraceae bacterium]|jgi:uncharacterized protein YbjT (DUF2867 family)|nr:NAD(P)H-binding protein [Solirubrobacteraceae bacterium]